MNWIEVVALTVVFLGLGAGAFLVAQRPSFWIEFGVRAFKALWPFLVRRMPPEEERAWRKRYLDGSKDDRR